MSIATPLATVADLRGDVVPREFAAPACALAAFALAAFAPAVFHDPDTWSHIATGEWILDHRAVPHVDPFTSSFAGRPWTAHEWLSEALLALACRAGGFPGVAVLTGAAFAASVYFVVGRAARCVTGPALYALAAILLWLLAPGLLARPHIFALPVFALWVQGLLRARDEERAPAPWLAALITLWANLHGGFAFGLALAAVFAGEAVFDAPAPRRVAVARDWATFCGLAVVAAAITPFGVEGLLFPVKLLGLHALAQIGEWAPESFAGPNGLEAAILGLVAVAWFRPVRLAPVRLALLLALLHLSLSHARHEQLLAIVGPMLLAPALGQAFGLPAFRPARDARQIALAAAVFLAIGATRLALPDPPSPAYASVRAALAALPPEARGTEVLNGYSFGGYLIFEGVKPFVDGRADMFGDAFLADYARLARGDPAALATSLPRFGWTLFAPDQGAVAALDATPGWRRVYADANVVAHARIP
jgi:hypothetical protein